MPHDLDAIFRAYHRELHRRAYGRLGDRHAAADVVQDAFVRYASMPAGPQGQGIENPRFFLWRVVDNLILDLGRRRRRWGEPVELDSLAEQLEDPRPTPEQSLSMRQQIALLDAALRELPENCRTALLLNRLDGLGHIEIGRRLGVSASMVSKYVMHALRHCAERLGMREN
jgi:RNA polymerase sigma factor (sigma-70 family)